MITFYDFKKNGDTWIYEENDFYACLRDYPTKSAIISYDIYVDGDIVHADLDESFFSFDQALKFARDHYKIWAESNK